ncbi:hypothetical protein MKZ38_010696 [Zalerion maritima]|uniref:Rhodopsin domain-containing protein n=1 Tax=Zalerion maritima TaxID=339359 RepID=A0AAD5RS31_9PEZI|nr:hypothetical protein MKZ38_010696 [Zalerion maritima]
MGDKGMGFPSDGIPNQGWKLYVTSLVMVLASGLFVIARCSARCVMRKFGSDDATICVSLAFSIFLSVAIQLAISNGYGMHSSDLSAEEKQTALKLFFIAQTPYKVVVCLNKVATILLYLRIFFGRGFRIACFTVMGIVVCWSIGAIGVTIFQCWPIERSWTDDEDLDLPDGEEATCIDKGSFWIAYAVMNILTDVMVLSIPIRPILKLQLGLKDRVLLCCIFLLGSFVTVTSILRTTSVENSLHNKQDITWNFIERGIWTLIEANLGIISTCIVVLKHPISKLLMPRILASARRNRSSKDPSSDPPGKGGDGFGGVEVYTLPSDASSRGGCDADGDTSLVPASYHPQNWRPRHGMSPQNLDIRGSLDVSRKGDGWCMITEASSKGSDIELRDGTRKWESGDKDGISMKVELKRTSFPEDVT